MQTYLKLTFGTQGICLDYQHPKYIEIDFKVLSITKQALISSQKPQRLNFKKLEIHSFQKFFPEVVQMISLVVQRVCMKKLKFSQGVSAEGDTNDERVCEKILYLKCNLGRSTTSMSTRGRENK